MKPKLTLSEKIFRISNACKVIERKGVGENNANADRPLYNYARIEDVLDVIHPLLKRYKLLLTGNIPKEPMTHVTKNSATTEVMVEWTLTDLESDYNLMTQSGRQVSQVFRVPGSAHDDQGKGVYRAMTGSRKYACILIFNLRLGDEPEATEARQEAKPAPKMKDGQKEPEDATGGS